jgi:hypothetical protein
MTNTADTNNVQAESVNGGGSLNIRDKTCDALNDLITEIAITQTYADCMEIVLLHFDDNRAHGDEVALEHVNRMKAMINGLTERLNLLETLASEVWEVAIVRAKPYPTARDMVNGGVRI